MKGLRHPNLLLATLPATAAVALAMVTRVQVFPAIILGLLAAHVFFNFRLSGKPRTLTAILLAVPFAIWYRNLPQSGFAGEGLEPIKLMLMIGCYALAFGVYHLLTWETGGNRQQTLAGAIIAFALAGTVSRLHFFTPLVPVFVVLVLLRLRQGLGLLDRWPSPGRLARYAAAAVVVAIVAIGFHTATIRSLPALSRWITLKMLESARGGSPGFTPVAHLGEMSNYWGRTTSNHIVLRHWRESVAGSGDVELVYLRGAVYDKYHHGSWRLLENNVETVSQESDRGRNIFNLPGPVTPSPNEPFAPAGTIYPDDEYSDTFFLPRGVTRIASFGDRIVSSAALTAQSRESRTAGGYVYYEPRHGAPPPDSNDLAITPILRDPLARIAAEVFDQNASPEQNAQRLALFFQNKFHYELGVHFTGAKDPVLEFLEDRHAGHCEYFASAAVLLLKTAGIPARYVTGFVCEEDGLDGAYKIARRKDAHAWVEIFVTGKGWQTFDPTPPDGRPHPMSTSTAQRLSDFIGTLWHMIGSVLGYGGFFGAASLLWATLMALLLRVPAWIWVVIVTTALLWIYREPLRRRLRFRRREVVPPRVKSLRAKLLSAEKMVAPHGLVREPGTTAGTFLRGVQAAPKIPPPVKAAAAALLEEYQATRFRNVQ